MNNFGVVGLTHLQAITRSRPEATCAWPGPATPPRIGIRLAKLLAPRADGFGRYGDAAFRHAFCHDAGTQAEEEA